ncbi:hypothetical protein EAI_03688 [Harpegnathos saltator]|uniref:Uncharacterized protein n=1 Tax=Harpegnathos saltator TaxID=610380 RepID=E2BCB9_HARSA|nr:hypothetical protein EAI_03688 [Harpegnathos saltator]
MKQPDAIEVIESPLASVMEHTSKILVAFAIAFLASLSVSSAAYIKKDFNTAKNFEKNVNFELPRTFREKRHLNEHFDLFLAEDDAAKIEDEPSEFHDRRAIAEEIKGTSLKYEEEEKQNAHKENSDTEGNTLEDAVSYKYLYNIIQALTYAENEDLNSTDADGNFSKLLKRFVTDLPYAPVALSGDILGTDFEEEISLEQLDRHSCPLEAFSYGHFHHSGRLTHEFFCEIRKFIHYMLYTVRGLKSELTLGPLFGDEFEGDAFGSFFRHTPQFVEAVIKEPHHLQIVPEIIRDVVPCPSIFRAILRIVCISLKVLHFVLKLIKTQLFYFIDFILFNQHLALRLILRVLHHLLGGFHLLEHFDWERPLEFIEEPILSPVVYDSEVFAPEYYNSFNEVVSSIRGIHDGYFASGIHDLFKSGVSAFTTTETVPAFSSFLTTIPFISNFVPFFNSLTESSVSTVDVSEVASPVVGGFGTIVGGLAPVFSSLAGLGPIFPKAVESESVSTSVSSTSSIVDESVAAPVVESPLINPFYGYGSLISPVASAYPVGCETPTSAVISASATVDAINPGLAAPVVAGPVIGNPALNLYGYGPLMSPVAPAYPVGSEAVTTATASATVDAVNQGLAAPVVEGPVLGNPALIGNPALNLYGYGPLMSPVASAYPVGSETVTTATASATVDAVNQGLAAPVVAGPVIGNSALNLYGYGPLMSPVASASPVGSETVTTATASAPVDAVNPGLAAPVVAGPLMGPLIGNPALNLYGYGPLMSPVVASGMPVEAESTSTSTVVETQSAVAAEPAVPLVSPQVVPAGLLYTSLPSVYASPVISTALENTAVSETSSLAVSESEPIVALPGIRTVPEVVSYAAPMYAPAMESTVADTSVSSATSISTVSDATALPYSVGPLGLASPYGSGMAPWLAGYEGRYSAADLLRLGYPLARPLGFLSSAAPVAESGVSETVEKTSVVSRRNYSLVLPREKIIGVLGSDCITPGDVVAVTLRNKSILYGNVLDAESPITFSFLRPRLTGFALRKGARVWNIMHSDFTDPECLDIFNDPVLLSY